MSPEELKVNEGFLRAVNIAKQNLPIQRQVVKPEFQVGYTIVFYDGEYRVFSADAWERPSERPLLPWSPPKGTKIAHVAQDETITFLETDMSAEKITLEYILTVEVEEGVDEKVLLKELQSLEGIISGHDFPDCKSPVDFASLEEHDETEVYARGFDDGESSTAVLIELDVYHNGSASRKRLHECAVSLFDQETADRVFPLPEKKADA